MKSNGLTAASYLPLADLGAEDSERALRQLASDGVAAYSTALVSAGEQAPPQRLYVDSARYEPARQALTGAGVPVVDNDDLNWARVVAGFDVTTADEPVHRWPVAEDNDDPHRTGGDSTQKVEYDDYLDDEAPPAAPAPTADEDEPFVPEPPAPLPMVPPIKRLAWAGVLGAPVLLVVATILGFQLSQTAAFSLVGAFLGGFAVLVATMERVDSDDDDPNGGAVV